MSRSRSPPAMGPSGVSIARARPATTASASPISARRWTRAARTCAESSAVRSGAAKSAASKTWWTKVPTRSPTGMAARGDTAVSTGSAGEAAPIGGRGSSGSSTTAGVSGSLATRCSYAPAVMSL